MPVSKKEIVGEVANRTGLTQVDCGIVVDELLATVGRVLISGRNIEIRGFGRFKLKDRKAHVARNPRTGEEVQIKAGVRPFFQASQDLKVRVNAKDFK